MIKFPFYQTVWLGIDLIEISKKLGHDLNHLASTNFYNHLYKSILKQENFVLEKDWLEEKRSLSSYIESVLNTLKLQQPSILSLGCGFGIVEQPLIQRGFKIDLQECQPYSIEYFKNNYKEEFKKTKFILSEDLSDIPSNTYDCILSITSTYCLDDKTLQSFLKESSRILKKGGFLIWYETPLTATDIIFFLKKKILSLFKEIKNEGVLWGWRRYANYQIKEAKKHKFNFLYQAYINEYNKIIFPKKIFGLPYTSNVSWQVMIFKKND